MMRVHKSQREFVKNDSINEFLVVDPENTKFGIEAVQIFESIVST